MHKRCVLSLLCVNDSLDSHPDHRLYLFDRYGLKPEPWTPAACIASWWRLGLFFAGDGLREIIPYYEVKEGVKEVRHFTPNESAQATEGLPVHDAAGSMIFRTTTISTGTVMRHS